MAILRPAVLPGKGLKDGTTKIRIAVVHNGTTRYIPTDIAVKPTEFRNGVICKRTDAAYLNTRLTGHLRKWQEALDELEYIDGMTCNEVVELLKAQGAKKRISIREVFDEYLDVADIAPGTKRVYSIAYATLSKCMSVDSPMETLTPLAVLSLDKKLRSLKLSPATIRNYMTTLSLMSRYAVRCGYVSYKIDPFANYTPPRKPIRDAWLTVEQMRHIRDCEIAKPTSRILRDIFMLSYYLGGMNLVDMLKIDFTDATRVKYVRQKVARKTYSTVEFDVPKQAQEIILKYRGRNGRLQPKRGKVELGHRLCIDAMPRLGKHVGIEGLIFYSARKSFAQHAFALGIPTSTIDYLLGHSLGASKGVLYHYIQVTPELASEALRKVIENLDNS